MNGKVTILLDDSFFYTTREYFKALPEMPKHILIVESVEEAVFAKIMLKREGSVSWRKTYSVP